MRTASRQACRWLAVVAALGVAVVATSVRHPAIANEPTDVRVVSVTRGGDGTVTMVVSVPARWVAAASGPGGLTVDGPSGAPLTPTVTALAPSASAVAVLLHTAGADGATIQRANGTAAELLRTLDPTVPVAIVTTAGGAVVAPLGIDRATSFAALSRTPVDGAVAWQAAVDAVGAQLAAHGYVDPLVVIIDGAATGAALPADAVAPAGMAWRIIPLGVAPSPTVAAFAQRAGVAVPAGDPVALVDDAVGLMQGRFSVRVADPGATVVTVHVRGAGVDLAAPVAIPAPATTAPPLPAATAAPPTPAATAVVTTVATTVAAPTTTEPIVLAERPAPSAVVVAPPAPAASRSSRWWLPVVGGVVAVAGLGGGALLFGRRRSARRTLDAEAHASTWPPSGATYRYTDLSQPLPSGAVKSRPRREIVTRVSAPPEPGQAPAPAVATFERRKRVLALAEELGNVSEACRIVGVSRRSYYEWKRIAEEQGIEALRPKRERLRAPED